MTKIALWKHLHTDSQSLLVVNCIQAGGLICLSGPPDWEFGWSLQAGARPVPWDKFLFFLMAVSCVGHIRLKTSHWSYRANVGCEGRF